VGSKASVQIFDVASRRFQMTALRLTSRFLVPAAPSLLRLALFPGQSLADEMSGAPQKNAEAPQATCRKESYPTALRCRRRRRLWDRPQPPWIRTLRAALLRFATKSEIAAASAKNLAPHRD
jgi:hypothetical protein